MITRAIIIINKDRIMFQAQPHARLLDLTAAELTYAIDNKLVQKLNEHTYTFTSLGRSFLLGLKDRQKREVVSVHKSQAYQILGVK